MRDDRGVSASRTTTVAALVALGAAGVAASSAPAGTAGASCAAQSVSFSTIDTGRFTWALPTTLLQDATARVQVQPAAGGAFTTVSTSTGVRTAGTRTPTGSITTPLYLTAGSWGWRVQVTEWDGTTFACQGPAFTVTRLPAPVVGFTGQGITQDGWRAPGSGQGVSVQPGAGDASAGSTSFVRVRHASGTWSTWGAAPATLPTGTITAVEARRHSAGFMSGQVTSVAIRTDTGAPSAPAPPGTTAEVGPGGATLAFGAAADDESGLGGYSSLVVGKDGSGGQWKALAGPTATVASDAAGGTLYLRACDRVGNCASSAPVSLVARGSARPARPAPPPGTGSGDPGNGIDGVAGGTAGGTSRRQSSAARRAAAGTPRITALVAGSPRGGAGRLTVELSRPAEVLFTIDGAAIARAWLGAGRTPVRLPAQPSARRAVLVARPVAGATAGDPVSTTVSLPGGERKGEAARRTTPMRAGALGVLYDMDPAVREVVDPLDGARGLTHERGALRQEPSGSGLFSDDDSGALLGKVTEEDMRGLTGAEMADLLREEITDAPGHVVAFDELSPAEADPRVPLVRGARIPPADPASPGAVLAEALTMLDTPSPYGGTWASRVHVYIAPAVTTAMAAGRGPDRNQGRDGTPRFRTYRTVMAGLARAGGVWIEAYHGKAFPLLRPFSAETWRKAPAAFMAEYQRAGGDPSRLHFLITGTDAYPAGRLPAECVTPQACQWTMAEQTPAGRLILANGVGGYRLGAHARPWLAEWQARMP